MVFCPLSGRQIEVSTSAPQEHGWMILPVGFHGSLWSSKATALMHAGDLFELCFVILSQEEVQSSVEIFYTSGCHSSNKLLFLA